MYRQLQPAVFPNLPLAQAIRDWPRITAGLSENPRARTRQTKRICDVLEAELG